LKDTMRALRSGLAAVLSVVGAAACGGGSAPAPTAPSAPTPPPAYVPAGTKLSINFIHDGTPASEATLTIASRRYAIDERGEVTLTENAPWGGLIDVDGSNILDRQTVVRSSMGTALTVWPGTTEAGIDPHYTSILVYTSAAMAGGQDAAWPLHRLKPGTTEVVVVPDAALRANARSMGAHEEAAARMTMASEGRVVYRVADTRPVTGVVVDTKLAPEDPTCQSSGGTVYAFAQNSANTAGEIYGSTIVYCVESGIVDYPNLILHELGHTFGLQHSPDPNEVMRAPAYSSGYMSARESQAMLLLLARPAGNRFPDNDRDVRLAGTSSPVIVCR
jgi:hypothetical protein